MLLLIFTASAILQTIVFQFLPPARARNNNGDYYDFYGPVARNLLTGKGLVDAEGKLATRYPPGFPLLLAGLFYTADHFRLDRWATVGLFNVLTSSLSCVCVFLIAEFAFSSRVALLSALAWMTYPPNVWFSIQPNSEVPYIPLFLLSVLAAMYAMQEQKPFLALLGGLALGLGGLIRPIALGSAVFLAGGLLLLHPRTAAKRAIFSAALVMGGFLLVILPWELYARVRTGSESPLQTKGSAAMFQGLTFALDDVGAQTQTVVPLDVLLLMQRMDAERPDPLTPMTIAGVLLHELKSDPIPTIKLILIKLVRGWYGTHDMHVDDEILVVQLIYLSVSGLGLHWAWKKYRDRRPYLWLLLLMVIAAWLMTVAVVPLLRYLAPQMSFLLMFAAVAVDEMLFGRRMMIAAPAAA